MPNSERTRMKINIGPQHPSTHGVLRLVLELEGEIIKSCEPVIGYLHRGMEKMAENRTYLQYLPTVDRVDYLSGFFNSYAFCDAVENLAKIEVSKRTKYIRVLTLELNRLASHLLWLGTYMLDLGATTPLFYCFRDREIILHLFEELTGQRLMYNYYTFGGLRHEVSSDWLNKVKDFVKIMPSRINDYEGIITNNPIFVARAKGVGIISKNTALQYSMTGPNLRASGINVDFRKQKPYLVYGDIEFDTAVAQNGDCYDRYNVRIEEMRTCLKIISQCVDWLLVNQGEVLSTVKQHLLKVPEGEYISNVEAPRGLCSCYVKSDGSSNPYRVKWRTGSYYSVQILPKLLIDSMYPDLMTIFGSLDVILPEVDR
ncbi:MAG TPA: NADH-quinone oxidoreductase subunit D [Candidatus Gastranaerophilaceae bacterium]|nr:NADH-quinone oxidoreductase subunit D [Candidatus Gastranaerophilaceae bacterium]HPT42099.1 NADH-quinone oxidoreductase subunit D [Candidatus Gastranaerophilaceae bacterium]